MRRFVVISGPSCVGKGPLLRAVERHYPELARRMRKVVLYNDREPRPGEKNGVDYKFVLRGEIQALPKDQYIKIQIRSDNFQALRLEDIENVVKGKDIVFLEAFYKFAAAIKGHPGLSHVREKTMLVFLSPLSKEEITFLKKKYEALIKEEKDRNKKVGAELEKFITDVMRRKLLRRVQRQKGIPSLKDLEDVEKRAGTAYEEMDSACEYDCVIPNHDGEDSDNWEQMYYPIGDARKVLLSFVDILEGRQPSSIEKW
jgi:guanylate kinase